MQSHEPLRTQDKKTFAEPYKPPNAQTELVPFLGRGLTSLSDLKARTPPRTQHLSSQKASTPPPPRTPAASEPLNMKSRKALSSVELQPSLEPSTSVRGGGQNLVGFVFGSNRVWGLGCLWDELGHEVNSGFRRFYGADLKG